MPGVVLLGGESDEEEKESPPNQMLGDVATGSAEGGRWAQRREEERGERGEEERGERGERGERAKESKGKQRAQRAQGRGPGQAGSKHGEALANKPYPAHRPSAIWCSELMIHIAVLPSASSLRTLASTSLVGRCCPVSRSDMKCALDVCGAQLLPARPWVPRAAAVDQPRHVFSRRTSVSIIRSAS